MNANDIIYSIVLKAFKYKRIPLEVKVKALAMFLQGMSVRRIGKLLNVSKTAVHYWTMRFRKVLNVNVTRKKRYAIAVDETKIKVNDRWYYIYASIDIETKELILIRCYSARNNLTTLLFLKEVKKYCENEDMLVITDKMPSYKYACDKLGLKWIHKTFGVRNYIEQVFRSFKFLSMRFNNCLNVNFKKEMKKWKVELWDKRVMYILFSWCKMFMFYWNVMKLGVRG